MRGELHELRVDDERWLVIAYPLPRAGALAVLTPGELAVVDAWVEGASMREIAGRRGTTVRTVAKQIASAYQKLGVSSRTEVVELMLALTEEG